MSIQHSIPTASSTSDESTKEIQKFLIKHLKLTPRRQLFEEHVKAAAEQQELSASGHSSGNNAEINNQIKKFDLEILNEISAFRKENPTRCMSSSSQQRLQRAKEREEKFLQSSCGHRCMLDERLFPTLFKDFEKAKQQKTPTADPQPVQTQTRMKIIRFAPDNSLALSHQKFKC